MAVSAAPALSAEPTDAAPARKPRKKWLVLLGAVVVLLGGGGAGAWFLSQGSASQEAPAAKAPVFLPLETFTINLQGDGHYLQIDITLQVADQTQVDTIKSYMPRVRSRLLSLLSSKQAEELASTEDKKKLAQEILAQVKLPFDPKGKPQQVDDVLFTSFVIQ
ncbi:flagellar basal body-associated protein FliL [Thiobacillus denitrificans]|uniref:flagellar basal body-associated protein FliL n=1 Tax=Thiobacillus denitrificans TaxID=36861 RepID=UPI000365B859|nr:flagellar basal body-associated protein FliL [Thiobacillus denitrificans]